MVLPGFSRGSSLSSSRAPHRRAHTLLRPLSSRRFLLPSLPFARSQSAPRLALSRHAFLSRSLASSRGGPRGVPGVVSSSHPLFHPRTAPARPGDVPLACPCAHSLSPPRCNHPADALSVSLSRSTPLSSHPSPSASHLADVLLLSLSPSHPLSLPLSLVTTFLPFSSFPLLGRHHFYQPPTRVILLEHARSRFRWSCPFGKHGVFGRTLADRI